MRILIAGLGAVGQRHARNLRTLCGPELELLAFRQRGLSHVVTPDLRRDDSRSVEEALGVRSFADLDAALALRPDAVFVCNTTDRHIEVAQRAADAGCHLFIEKPLGVTLAGADRLAATVESRHLIAMICCQWRFHPLVARLHALMAQGALGTIESAEIDYAEWLPDWHKYEDFRTTWPAIAAMGGGVVLAHIHDYDLAHWLFGPARQVRASGVVQGTLALDVEESVDALIETSGTRVRVRQSFASHEIRRRIAVTGSSGTVVVDLVAGELRADPAVTAGATAHGFDRNAMFLDAVAHFLAAVEGRERCAVPLSDGIAVLRTALAVKESLRTDSSIAIAG